MRPPLPAPDRTRFAAKTEDLTAQLAELGGRDAFAAARPKAVFASLPSAPARPLASPEIDAAGPATETDGQVPALATWRVPALAFEAAEVAGAAQVLLALAAAPPAPEVVIGGDLRFWISATRFGLELLHRQRVLPALVREGERYVARWRPLLGDEADAQRFGALAGAMPPACRALSWEIGSGGGPKRAGKGAAPPPGPRSVLESYLGALTDAVPRQARREARAGAARRSGSSGYGGATTAEAWWEALFGAPAIDAAPEALRAFATQFAAWLQRGGPATGGAAETFRVSFRLNPPAETGGPLDAGVSAPGDG